MISTLKKLDIDATLYLNNKYASINFIRKLLIFVTHSSASIMLIVYSIVLYYFTNELTDKMLIQGLTAFTYQVPIYLLSKNIIKRQRPYIKHKITLYINPPDHYSFPSGHTASAVVITLLVGKFFPSLLLFFIFWMVLIFISRVSLGLHYLSDIIAGSVLGISSYYASILIVKYFLFY